MILRASLLMSFLWVSLQVNCQALLGASLDQLRVSHPDKKILVDYTEDGTMVATFTTELGMFMHGFDKESGLTYIRA